ncbi:MAG: hypothetical protein Kow00129_05310 [Thermoleophilia bacterium]
MREAGAGRQAWSYSAMKKRARELLEVAGPREGTGRALDLFLVAVISLSILAVVLETVSVISDRYGSALRAFNMFSVAVFTVEYLARIWSATADPRYAEPVRGRLRWATTPMAIIDLLAVLPFYLPFGPWDLRFLRAMRLLRLMRVFKLARYSDSLALLAKVVRAKKDELAMTLGAVLFLLFLASSLIYYLEHESQPEAFSSIPTALWWGVATLTTVGYGDIYPVTAAGRILGSAVALLGVGLFAMPAGILASGFTAELERRKQRKGCCPECGREYEQG